MYSFASPIPPIWVRLCRSALNHSLTSCFEAYLFFDRNPMLNFLKAFSVAGVVRRAFARQGSVHRIERVDLKTVSIDPLVAVWEGALRLDIPKIRQRMAEIVAAQKRLRPICHSPLPFIKRRKVATRSITTETRSGSTKRTPCGPPSATTRLWPSK